MRDYEELVKRLRNCTSDTVEDCAGCPYQGCYKGTYCMNGLISEASDAIEELVSNADKPKWISVEERLPEKGTVVLAFGTRSATTGQFQGVGTAPWFWWWKGHTIKRVTHWMPLPEPPKEDT